jgi:hypothetical protein
MSKHCHQYKSEKTVPFLAGVSTLGHTEGKTGTVSHGLILQGGHNITLKENRHHRECATIKINAQDQSVQTQNLFDLTLAGNTSGTLNLISSGTLTLAGGNNITLSQEGNIITISAATIGAGSFLAGMSTLGNTQGIVGVVSDQLVFAGGNNVTLSQNIVGQSATITISAGASILIHDSVYHTNSIGAESQISFNTLSGHQHDGIDSRLIIIPEYVEVSKTELGKSRSQFTSIAAAVASILDATVTKPYIVRVHPGIYTEPPFSMKSYVDIIGSGGMYDTIIETNDNTQHFITGASASQLRNCAITGPTDDFQAAIHYSEEIAGDPKPVFIVQDVLIRAGYYGIYVNPVTEEAIVHVVNVGNWYIGIPINTFIYGTGTAIVVCTNASCMCNATDTITRGFVADSATSEIYLYLCTFKGTPGTNVIDGIFLDNGATARLMSCTFAEGTNAIHIGSNGTGADATAMGCIIRLDEFDKDIWIENFATMQFIGACTKSKIIVDHPANPSFTANFTDLTTGEEGAVVYGELWLGTSDTNSIPLRDYGLAAYSSGWKSGGAVTRAGGLNLSVALGTGYINTGTGVTKITWSAISPVTCASNASSWIYVNNAGIVTASTTEPNYPNVILLAAVRTSLTDVVFLADHDILLQQIVPTVYDYIKEVFGPVSISGCLVTQNVGNPLKVDFATGKYYTGLTELQAATTSPITFTYWYRKTASSGWNCVTSSTVFDTTQYDNNTGTLAALPPNKYKKDLLYVVKNDVGTEFHVIYGQHIFDTVDQAEADATFEVPDVIGSYGLKLSGIVVLSGATVIASIVEEKAKFISEHNSLLELQGGDYVIKQYYHLNYNEWTARNQKIVASIVGNSTSAGVGYGVISTGTMYLSGGNNVTLLQNGQSIGINGANVAIAAGGVTITGSTFTFGDKPGISFQTSNGSIIGSLDNFITSQSNQALSGDNTSFTFQTATFGNANGLSFYVSNGSMVGSYTVPTQTIQTSNIINEVSLSGNTAGLLTDITSGTLFLAGGNNITLIQNANSITISGAAVAGGTFSGGATSLGNTDGATGTVSNQLIFVGGNNITLSQFINAGSATITIDAATVAGGSFSAGVSNIGNTLGNTGTVSQQLVLVGGNNITLSQDTTGNSAIVTISGPQFNNANNITFGTNAGTLTASASFSQSIQTDNILSPLAIIGNTTGTNYTLAQGAYYLSAGNNVTLSQDISSTNVIVLSAAIGIQGIEISNATQSSTATAGSVLFQTGNGITFGLNGNTITASHNALTSQSTAPSGLYATNVATTFTSGNIGFSGTNNITVSTAAQAIIISGANTHPVQTGISSIGATDATYTSGGVTLYGSGIVSLSSTLGQGIVISAPGVISLNGYSSTVTISAGNLMSINNAVSTINVINLLSSATTVSSITSVNVIGTNASRFALEDHQHAGVEAIGISSGGNISGNTAVLPGQLVFVGGNNITLSQATSSNNNMTMTISGGGLSAISYWKSPWDPHGPNGTNNQALSIQRISIGNQISATQLDMIGVLSANSSVSGGITFSVGLYNMSHSTAYSMSTTNMALSWTSGSNAASSAQYGGQSGTRYRSVALGTWNITPGEYLFLVVGSNVGAGTVSFSLYGKTSISIGFPGGGNYTQYWNDGYYGPSTGAMPASIVLANMVQVGASAFQQPWFALIGTF